MPALDSVETPTPALTALSPDEQLFQTTVRKFAREQIRPYVREMDEAGVFRKDIIKQFFEMGLMGIEIPEEYGGQGGTFFQAMYNASSASGMVIRKTEPQLKYWSSSPARTGPSMAVPPPSADHRAIDRVRAGPDHSAVIRASVVG